MPLLNKTLCDLLRSLRSQVTAFACQAATELFCSMQSTARPVSCTLTMMRNNFIYLHSIMNTVWSPYNEIYGSSHTQKNFIKEKQTVILITVCADEFISHNNIRPTIVHIK